MECSDFTTDMQNVESNAELKNYLDVDSEVIEHTQMNETSKVYL